jgi:predicted ester cyclase
MAQDSPATVLRRWFQEVWNEKRLDRIEELARPDAITHGLDDGSSHGTGIGAFRDFHDRMRAMFTDIQFLMHDVIETDGMAAGRWTVQVRLAGAAPGKEVSLTGMTIIRIEDGRIAEGWNEWDRLSLARATGQLS